MSVRSSAPNAQMRGFWRTWIHLALLFRSIRFTIFLPKKKFSHYPVFINLCSLFYMKARALCWGKDQMSVGTSFIMIFSDVILKANSCSPTKSDEMKMATDVVIHRFWNVYLIWTQSVEPMHPGKPRRWYTSVTFLISSDVTGALHLIGNNSEANFWQNLRK